MDTMLANVCKQNVTRNHFEVARLAMDLAGGFIATLPSQYDLELGPGSFAEWSCPIRPVRCC